MEITVKQAAEKLGVSRVRVHQFIAAGRIKARAISPKLMLIDVKELAKVKNRKPGRPRKGR
jgi:excisionase family DNA binding protein